MKADREVIEMRNTAIQFGVFFCCSFWLCTAVGCSDGRPKRVPVSGIVQINGKPVPAGFVRFVPEEGRPASGRIGSDGRFVLSTFGSEDGCSLGKHEVAVSACEDINNETRRWHAPKKYENHRASNITQIIDGPTDSILIELSWGGQPGPFIEKLDGGE
jgi:hypothetical protein